MRYEIEVEVRTKVEVTVEAPDSDEAAEKALKAAERRYAKLVEHDRTFHTRRVLSVSGR